METHLLEQDEQRRIFFEYHFEVRGTLLFTANVSVTVTCTGSSELRYLTRSVCLSSLHSYCISPNYGSTSTYE